jgi:hypothetical protein
VLVAIGGGGVARPAGGGHVLIVEWHHSSHFRGTAKAALAACLLPLIWLTACGGGGGGVTQPKSFVSNGPSGGVATKTYSGTQTVVSPETGASITVSPALAQITTGDTLQFTATVQKTTEPITWSLSGPGCTGAACGTVSGTGLYTAPATAPSPAVVLLTAAAGSLRASASISIVTTGGPVGISVSPAVVTLPPGGTQAFTTAVTGTATLGVTWSVSGPGCSGAACGAVSAAGVYTAPASAPTGNVLVTAVSQADTTKSASALVTIVAPTTTVGVSISPAAISLPIATSFAFSATVTGTANTNLDWSVHGSGCTGTACGTITPAGVYTAPAAAPVPNSVMVTAISQADPSKAASASVTITTPSQPISVKVSPSSAAILTGASQQFSATVTGTSNTQVTWSVFGSGCSGTACGVISSSGLYTAPAVVPASGGVTIVAASVADPTQSGSASAAVVAPKEQVTVSVSPAVASVAVSGTQQFTATVTGTANTNVTWSVFGPGCSGTACGVISASGLYTAPATAPSPATVIVNATSVADPSQVASSTVAVVPPATPVAISLSPQSVTVDIGSTQQFTPTVTGTANTAVTWTLFGAGCTGSACGTIFPSGLYTAPTAVPSPSTVLVTATSQADTSKSASASVTLNDPSFVPPPPPPPPGSQPPGTSTSTLVFTPASVQFPTTALTQTSTMQVSLQAQGSTDVTVNSYFVDGLHDFSVTTTLPITIPAGTSKTVDLAYSPTVTGSVSANLNFNSTAANPVATLPVSGYGATVPPSGPPVQPLLTLTPASSLAFPDTNVNTTSHLSVTLKNSGNAQLLVSGGTVSSTSCPNCWVVSGNFPIPLDPGATDTVDVAFTPTTTGAFTGSLTFASNTAVTPPPVTVTGTGTNPSPVPTYLLSVQPTSVTFPTVYVGSGIPATGSVDLVNQGNSPVEIQTVANIAPPFSMTNPAGTPFTIAAGAKQPVTLQFAPNSTGTFNGAISFYSNATNNPVLTVTLTGAGDTHRIDVAWGPSPTPNITRYRVYRASYQAVYFTVIAEVVGVLTYTDPFVTTGVNYFYYVTAVNDRGDESVPSPTAQTMIQ